MKFATFEHNGQRRVGLLRLDAGAIRPIDATDLVEGIAQFDALKPSLTPDRSGSGIAWNEEAGAKYLI